MMAGIVAGGRPVAASPPAGNDPYWSNVGLYMRFNGVDGATLFTDEKGSAITSNGSAAISASDGFGGACGNLTAGSYLSGGVIPAIGGMVQGSAWSVEVRAKVTWAGDRNAGLFSYSPLAGADDFRFFLQRAGSSTYIYIAAEGATAGRYGTYTHVDGQFMAFQASSDGTTIRVFIDGSEIALTAFDYTSRSCYQTGLLVGTIGDIAGHLTTNSLVGQIDELRVTKGQARNTSPYAPATTQFPNY